MTREWIEGKNKEFKEKMEEIKKDHMIHHEAYVRVYVSRKLLGEIYPYTGIYGTGYKVYRPNWGSSRYSVVEYWIER